MNLRAIIPIGITLVTGVSLISGLYLQMQQSQIKPYFKRSFIQPHLHSSDTFAVQKTSYIAGISDTSIIIGTRGNDPAEVINLRTGKRKSLSFSNSITKENEILEIDSKFIYSMNREIPSIGYRSLKDSCLHLLPTPVPFIQCVPITPSSYALRTINAAGENTIVKFNPKGVQTGDDNILTKQKEGLYSTAGRLHYSITLHRIVYLYHFRNEYIQYDTNLMVISKANTIDSNRYAKVKAISTAPGRFTLASPSSVVNRLSAVFQNYLFVCSNVQGIGESDDEFKTRSTIDVYDLSTTSYISSFYIRNYKNQRLNSFGVNRNRWVGMYEGIAIVHFIDFDQALSFLQKHSTKDILLGQ